MTGQHGSRKGSVHFILVFLLWVDASKLINPFDSFTSASSICQRAYGPCRIKQILQQETLRQEEQGTLAGNLANSLGYEKLFGLLVQTWIPTAEILRLMDRPIKHLNTTAFMGHQTATTTMCKLTVHFICNHGQQQEMNTEWKNRKIAMTPLGRSLLNNRVTYKMYD